MTLDGTNTWVIGEPGGDGVVVIDPGPADEAPLRRVAGQVQAEGRSIALILLTHGHRDHSGGVRRLAELTSAAVRALDPAHRLGGEGLASGDVVTAGGGGPRGGCPPPADAPLPFFPLPPARPVPHRPRTPPRRPPAAPASTGARG